MRLLLKYGLPYGVSTLATVFAAGAEKFWQTGELLTVLLCWAGENGGYYFTAMACDRFLPVEERIFKQSGESLKQLLLVESADTVIRLALLWVCPILLGNRQQGAALGSLIADISFALCLQKSHRLVAICSLSGRIIRERVTAFKDSPHTIRLGIAVS